jgi:ribosomal-protein-alanine N-acetyltransferase
METPRIRLRPVEPRDASAIAALMTDPVSRRLANWPSPLTPEMAAGRVAEAIAEREAGLLLPLVVECVRTGELIGWISARRGSPPARHAVLTYWLGEQHHGRGLMREAAPLAVQEAFRVLDVDALRAAVQPDNVASLAVMRGIGAALMCEGKIHVPTRNRHEDCVYWRLDRPAEAAAPTAGLAAGEV